MAQSSIPDSNAKIEYASEVLGLKDLKGTGAIRMFVSNLSSFLVILSLSCCLPAWTQTATPPMTQQPTVAAPQQPSTVTAPGNPAVSDATKPMPGTDAPVNPQSYVIGPEDVLRINVWRDPETSGQVQVRPDGIITLPLIGEVQAGGKTPSELQTAIAAKLAPYVREPRVTVGVQQVLSKKYSIIGEVNRTGQYPLIVPIRVLDAVTNAGGFREFAKSGKVVIIRGDERLKFNYKDVVKGKRLEQNVYLQNGDVIYVP